VLRQSPTQAPPLSPIALLQPPRGYRPLAWLGLVSNVLLLPSVMASVALLKWRAWGQILAIVALALGLAIGLPYAIVRLALVAEGRVPTAALAALLTAAMTAALVYWCRPCIRRYLT